jgi:hypothetical protein
MESFTVFKSIIFAVITIIFASSYWFYHNMVTPQGSSIRVMNLPWQITVIDDQVLHVFDLDIGKTTLGEAVNILRSEYNLAWFENQDESLSLEAYFIRINISGLRAKILLELDTKKLDKTYLLSHSGKPEIQSSRTIKYPLDDLAEELTDRSIRSLTYIPLANINAEMIMKYFGQPEERLEVNDNSQYWLYPKKGLVISLNEQGKDVFQYIPIAQFSRLKQSILTTIEYNQLN